MTWASFEGGLAPRQKTGGTAWREAGRGPPVLLLHGVGLNADAWEPQIAALAPRHRVIAIDLPGHGRSNLMPEDAGLDDFVKATAALIDDLALSPLPLIGHAFGAMIGLGLALDRPEQVTGLVMLNAVYCRDAQARAAVEGRARRATGGNIDVIEKLARWFPDDPNGPLARRVAGWLRVANPKGYALAYRIFATGDRAHEGRLGELGCPALFMTGVADPLSAPVMSERMAREAPQARAVALPGARHMMNLTHPAETSNTIATFLKSLPRPPA